MTEESSNKEIDTTKKSPEKTYLSRRDFLKLAGGTVAAIAATKLIPRWLTPNYEDQARKTENSPAENVADVDTKPVEYELCMYNGVTVYAEENTHIPTRWRDARGNSGYFDQEELNLSSKRAFAFGKTELAAVQRVTTRDDVRQNRPPEPLESKSQLPSLPEDTVNKEELKERGIEIIGSEKIDLDIRAGAFDEGGLLEHYRVGGSNRLKILIVDSPTLTSESFAGSRYDQYRDIINTALEFDTEGRTIGTLSHRISELENHPPDKSPRNDPSPLEVQMLEYGAVLQTLRQITEEEKDRWGLESTLTGYWLPAGHESGDENSSLVFIPIATQENKRSDNLWTIQIKANPSWNRPENRFSVSISPVSLKHHLQLPEQIFISPDQSYPSADDFPVLEELIGYTKERSPGVDPARFLPAVCVYYG